MKQFFILSLVISAFSLTAHAETGIQVMGTSHDMVTNGSFYNLSNSFLDSHGNSFVNFRFTDGSNSSRSIDLEIRTGDESTFVVGKEYSLNHYTSLLTVGDVGQNCESVQKFKVLEYVQNQKGKLIKFAADFTQTCKGSQEGFKGQIRYKSALALSLLQDYLDNSSSPGKTLVTLRNGSQTITEYSSPSVHQNWRGIQIDIGNASLTIAAPNSEILSAGKCYSSENSSQIDFSYSGIAYIEHGEFCIKELSYSPNGTLKRISLDFRLTDSYQGTFKYNANL